MAARLLVLSVAFCGSTSQGGLPELVGVISIATSPDFAAKAAVSESQKNKLYEVSDRAELRGAGLLMAAKDLSVEDRNQRLAPFRLAVERQGLAVLTQTQKAQLFAAAASEANPAYGDEGAIAAAMGFDAGLAESKRLLSEGQGPSPSTSQDEAASTETPPSLDPPPTKPAEAPSAAPPLAQDAPVDPPTPAVGAATAAAPPADGLLTINFRYQPWKEVIDWYAQQAGLSLVLETAPAGTFNYQDTRRYTPAQALDVLNSVLLTKGYTLVRKGRMLLLVNLEDGVPPNLVTDVPLDQIDDRGEYELVRVLLRVEGVSPTQAAQQLQPLVGPQGNVVVVEAAGMVQVTETAGRIRVMRDVVEAMNRGGALGGMTQDIPLKYASPDEVLAVVRPMLGIPEGTLATPDSSLKLALGALGDKLLARGTPERIGQLKELVALVDLPAETGASEAPQLEVYPVTGIDPEVALAVMQTLLAGRAQTRLACDPQSGALVALTTPAGHATIRATLSQMGQDARQIEVIPLTQIDPASAVLAINKLFAGRDPEKPDPRAPVVDADLATNSLLVRASASQVEQIRQLLAKLGESESAAGAARGNVRILPYSGPAARAALQQVEKIWPALRQNNIRVVTPSEIIPSYVPSDPAGGDGPDRDPLQMLLDGLGDPGGATPSQPRPDRGADTWPVPKPKKVRARFAVDGGPVEEPAQQPAAEPAERPSNDGSLPSPDSANPDPANPDPANQQAAPHPPATIYVAPGPGGTIVASKDTQALDEFEELLAASAGRASASGREYAVFYLRYAQAPVAAQVLSQVFGASSGGGGDLLGGIAGAALGGAGGGLMGDILGLGGGGESSAGFSSASVDIVPDVRLNALIVYARPDDLSTIERLLRILDQRIGPAEVEAEGKPRMIPVQHTSAAKVAEIVKQVYQDRIQQSAGGGAPQQPNPEVLLRMLRGGRGGGGAGGGEEQEPAKMSIGVDERSNSLVVRAPDALFEEVVALVEQLDEEGLGTPQSTRVVSLRNTNSEAVKDALRALLGEDAVTSSEGPANANQRPSGQNGQQQNAGGDGDAQRRQQEFMQRMEFFRRLREQGGGGPPGFGPPGGGGPGGGRRGDGGGRPGGR